MACLRFQSINGNRKLLLLINIDKCLLALEVLITVHIEKFTVAEIKITMY